MYSIRFYNASRHELLTLTRIFTYRNLNDTGAKAADICSFKHQRTLSPFRLILKVTPLLLLLFTGMFLCIGGVLTRLGTLPQRYWLAA